jgi:hypothetical protein
MKILLIDDLRSKEEAIFVVSQRYGRDISSEEHEWTICRTFLEGREAFMSGNEWDLLLMDHDLGGGNFREDGTLLMSIMEELFFISGRVITNHMYVISSNPIGSSRMSQIFGRIQRERI